MSTPSPESRFRIGRCRSGLGLFARVPLRAGQRVIEYTGERISTEEADRRGGRYLFHVDDKRTIDATGRDNLARYINHACRPNCEARTVGRRIVIYARRAIEPGEELTYHYGAVYFRAFIEPAGCRCATCIRRAAHGDHPAGSDSTASTTASGASRGRKWPARGTSTRR